MRLIRLRQSSLRGLIGNQQYWCSSGFARTYEQAKMMEEQEKLKKGLEEQLRRMQIKEEELMQQTQRALGQQKEAVFTSRTPAKEILLWYMDQKEVGEVNHDLLANTIHQLGLVMASRPQHSPTFWDLNKFRLFKHSAFEVLMYDLKKALRQDVVSLPALSLVMQSLPRVQYYDEEVLQLVYAQVETALGSAARSLLEIPEFNRALSEILHEGQAKSEDPIEAAVRELKESIRRNQENVLRLMRAVEGIQKNYFQLVGVQSEKYIEENLQLNFKMMQMEEMLVEMGLLSIEDVKDGRHGLSDEQVRERVAATVWEYISRGSNQLDNFFEHLFSLKFTAKAQEVKVHTHHEDHIGALILALAECANFVGRNAADYTQEEALSEDLSITQERIFNFNYRKCVELAQSQLHKIKDEAGALGLAKLGLFDECRHVLNGIEVKDHPTYLEAALISNFPVKNVDKIEDHVSRQILDNHQLLASTVAILHQRLADGTHMSSDLIQQVANRFDATSHELLYDVFLYLKVKKLMPQEQNQLQAVIAQSPTKENDNELLNNIVSLFQKRADTAFTKAVRNNLQNLPIQLRPQVYTHNSAITVLSSHYTSLTGEVDGRVLFRHKLLQELFGKVQIKLLPLVHLLDDNLRLKNRADFNAIVRQYFEIENLDTLVEIKKFLNSLDLGQVEERTLNDLSNLNLKFTIEKAKTLGKDAKEVLLDLDQKLKKFTSISSPLSGLIQKLSDPEAPQFNNQWIGKVLGQSHARAENSAEGFSVALLNQDFMIDRTYCPYNNENIAQLQKVTGHMLRKSKLFGECQVHPRKDSIRTQITPEYLKQDSKQFMDLLREHQYDQCLTGDYFLFNLLNMKAEIKRKFKLEEIAGKILSLDFWEKLFQSRSPDSNQIFLTRNGYEYLKQEQDRNDRVQVQSRTLSFLYDQHSQKQALNEMLNIRQEILDNLAREAKEKKISKLELNEVRDKVDQKILEKIKDFKDQMKQKHTSQFFKSKQSFIDFQMTPQDIANFEYQDDFQNLNDTDLYLCKGNADKLMLLKRSRAEEKMMLMHILYKTYHKQALTEAQQEFLQPRNWLYEYQPQFTTLNLQDLSASDKAFFQQFLFSNLNEYQQFSLNELILELSQFFENSMVEEFMRRQTLKSLGQEYNLKAERYYKDVKRNSNKLLLSQREQKIWKEQSKLSEHELEQLVEIIRIPQAIDFRRKEEREKEVERQKEAIVKLNGLSQPLEAIVEYVKAREREVKAGVDMSAVQESQDIWKTVFGKNYEESTEKQLHEFVEQLVERMYLAKYYPPPFLRKLIKLILVHPNLSRMDYELLAGYADAFHVDLRFTSQDILELKENQQNDSLSIRESLRDSEYPFFSKLWSDLNL